MTASSAPLEYPSSGEFNVLVQRFKLLNLVQRVAHRDVREMLDTVGLESLARKGTLSRWAWAVDGPLNGDREMTAAEEDDNDVFDRLTRNPRGGRYGRQNAASSSQQHGHWRRGDDGAGAFSAGHATRHSSPDSIHPFSNDAIRTISHRVASPNSGGVSSRRTTPPSSSAQSRPPKMSFGRPTSGFDARLAAARANVGVEEDNDNESKKYGATRRVATTATSSATAAAPRRSPTESEEATTRRRYVVRRTRRVVRRGSSDRDSFFARLAEPRERLGAVVEDVLVYDDEDRDPAYAVRQREVGRGRSQSTEGFYRSSTSRGPQQSNDYYEQQRQREAARQAQPYPPQPYNARDIRAHYQGAMPAYYPPPPPPHRSGSNSRDPQDAQWMRASVGENRRGSGALDTPDDPSPTAYSEYTGAMTESSMLPLLPQQRRQRLPYLLASGPSALYAREQGMSPLLPQQQQQQQQQQQAASPLMSAATAVAASRSREDESCGPNMPSGDRPLRRRGVNFAVAPQADGPYQGREEGEDGDVDDPPGSAAAALRSPEEGSSGGGVGSNSSTAIAANQPAPSISSPLYGRGAPTNNATHANNPPMPQLQLPLRRNSSVYTEVEEAAAALENSASGANNDTTGLLSSSRGAGGSNSGSPNTARTRSTSLTSGAQKSPRIGRGLAPKAKPKGALESPRVPVEAVRHAAALLSRSTNDAPGHNSLGGAPEGSLPSAAAPPQFSGAHTPPAGSAFRAGGGGILRSPRPHTVVVQPEHRHENSGDEGRPLLPDGPLAPSEAAPVSPLPPFGAAVGVNMATPPSPALASSGRPPVAVTVERSSPASTPQQPLLSVAAPSPLIPRADAAAQQSFQEVSSKVDHMLQNLQQMLHRVLKNGDGDTTAASAAAPASLQATQPSGAKEKIDSADAEEAVPHASAKDSYGSSSFENSSEDEDGDDTIEVNLDSGTNLHRRHLSGASADAEDEEDEMLLYTRIQNKVSRLGAEMSRMERAKTASNNSSNEDMTASQREEVIAAMEVPPHAKDDASAALAAASSSGLGPAKRVPRRARGEVPDAVVQRLCAYRMDHFQYIAYNERLWNTSTTSQFVFAQRLTVALLEECWTEVMAEVDANMSEYVEGLVDHELQ